MKLTRRQALHLFGMAGLSFAGGSMIPNLAWAQQMSKGGSSTSPHLFLLLRVNGGWDVMMGMDAKDLSKLTESGINNQQLLFVDGRKNVRQHNQAFLGQPFSPLFPYLNDISIVNGMMMAYNNPVHEVNRAYMASGSLDLSVGFGPFQIARGLPKREMRIGYRLEREQIRDGGYGKKVPLSSLVQAANSAPQFDSLLVSRSEESDEDDRGSQSEILKETTKEQVVLSRLQDSIRKLTDNQNRSSQGMQFARQALAGLASGYLQAAICDIVADGSMDTHSSHQTLHVPSLTAGMTDVATLIKLMKETPYEGEGSDGKSSVFDVTTVMVMSEFSRSSAPQSGTGTDHNQINNSALIFGKNIKGGQVVGESGIYSSASTTILHANLFDYEMQRPISQAEMTEMLRAGTEQNVGKCSSGRCLDYIYPETLWRTIGKAAGLENVPGLDKGFYLKGLIKS